MNHTAPVAASARQVLKSTPLFAALDEAELNSLAVRSRLRWYAQGEVLFSEGEACAGLYMVVAGRIRIFKTSATGREQVLSVEGTGAPIAELPVFDGGTYPASASALEPSEMLFVSRSDLRAICLEHPEVSLNLLQVVGARLRRLVRIIEELSFTTVRHRLISLLLRDAKAQGRATARGVTFVLSGGHQGLASQIGTVRELVARNLTRLQAQSYLSYQLAFGHFGVEIGEQGQNDARHLRTHLNGYNRVRILGSRDGHVDVAMSDNRCPVLNFRLTSEYSPGNDGQ